MVCLCEFQIYENFISEKAMICLHDSFNEICIICKKFMVFYVHALLLFIKRIDYVFKNHIQEVNLRSLKKKIVGIF